MVSVQHQKRGKVEATNREEAKGDGRKSSSGAGEEETNSICKSGILNLKNDYFDFSFSTNINFISVLSPRSGNQKNLLSFQRNPNCPSPLTHWSAGLRAFDQFAYWIFSGAVIALTAWVLTSQPPIKPITVSNSHQFTVPGVSLIHDAHIMGNTPSLSLSPWWSDGMRCCGSDWPGLCLFCCYTRFGLFYFMNFPILLPTLTPPPRRSFPFHPLGCHAAHRSFYQFDSFPSFSSSRLALPHSVTFTKPWWPSPSHKYCTYIFQTVVTVSVT